MVQAGQALEVRPIAHQASVRAYLEHEGTIHDYIKHQSVHEKEMEARRYDKRVRIPALLHTYQRTVLAKQEYT